MPDFDAINNTLKATWIRRLDNGYPSASWTHIPVTMLEKCGGKFLLKCNFDLKNLNVRIPLKFYEKALLAWQSINLFTPSSEEEILDEILWNNWPCSKRAGDWVRTYFFFVRTFNID